MYRVLVIGFSSEDGISGRMPASIEADEQYFSEDVRTDLRSMRARGWKAEHVQVFPDEGLERGLLQHIFGGSYNCIVISTSVRMTTKHVHALELVLNAVRKAAPFTPVAFNSGPDESGEAAARWLTQMQEEKTVRQYSGPILPAPRSTRAGRGS